MGLPRTKDRSREQNQSLAQGWDKLNYAAFKYK